MRIDDYLDLDVIFAPFGVSGASRRRRRNRHVRQRRRFGRGGFRLAVLALVEERPMHGYEVMSVLAERSGGLYRPSPGSVYPTLQLLEDQGRVTVQEQDGKKVYTITENGREHLDRHRDAVERIFGDGTGRDETADACRDGPRSAVASAAADLARHVARVGQTTLQGCLRWAGDEQFRADAQDILDRALEELDVAWDEARKRSRTTPDQSDDAAREASRTGD